jgi:hypothetical protein
MYRKYPQTETKIRRTLARQLAREGLRNYVRYVNAARDPDKLAEFRAAFFNQGFSDAMLFRMWMLYTKSEGTFAKAEMCALRIQRIWRGRMLRRKVNMAQYKARMDRDGLLSGFATESMKRRGFYGKTGVSAKTQKHLEVDVTMNRNVRDALILAKVVQEPMTVEVRLEQMEVNQRMIMEQLLKVQESLKVIGESAGGGGGGGGISSGFSVGGIGGIARSFSTAKS